MSVTNITVDALLLKYKGTLQQTPWVAEHDGHWVLNLSTSQIFKGFPSKVMPLSSQKFNYGTYISIFFAFFTLTLCLQVTTCCPLGHEHI